MLDRCLSSKEVDYVLFHLSNHLVGFELLRNKITYGPDDVVGINFPASASPLRYDTIIKIDSIPVLFPASDSEMPYTFSDGCLKFNHDFLKSAFFLLSGYQEYAQPDEVDQWGRFKYESSLQLKLNCIHKPLVNYYFQWIIEGLVEYVEFHGLDISVRMPFGRMALHLSHDIDLVRYHSPRKIAYRILQILFLKPRSYGWRAVAKSLISSVKYLVDRKNAENPYWSFSKILNTERYFGFKSSWYFLPQDGGPVDADYTFDEADVKDMIVRINGLGNEVGLHGSIKSSKSEELLKLGKSRLSEIINSDVVGNRMHYLTIEFPFRRKLLEEVKIKYDCSMGFSRAEGFRNGYCFPYHPWDFESERMMDLWEIPLIAMDATIFGHNRRSFEDAYQLFEVLLDEVSRFNGVFSLLWHNSMFDEFEQPGILKFYEDLHLYLSQYSPNSLTGNEIIERITSTH